MTKCMIFGLQAVSGIADQLEKSKLLSCYRWTYCFEMPIIWLLLICMKMETYLKNN